MTKNLKLENGLPVPEERDGLGFEGWFFAPDGGSKAEDSSVYQRDTTLYGRWKALRATLTFDTDGGTEIAPITQECGTAITPPAYPTKPGYTFAGWKPELPAVMPTNNLTVKAKWTANPEYTLMFDTAGGSAVPPVKLKAGEEITPPAYPTKPGYTFAGWDPKLPAVMPTNNLTVSAKWTANPEYTLTFDTDGGTKIGPITQDFGTVITRPVDPTKTGYTFIGWEPEWPNTMPDHDMMLKAVWGQNVVKKEPLETVPDGLKDTPFNTVEKIKNQLFKAVAHVIPKEEASGSQLMDVLLYIEEPGKPPRLATKEEMIRQGSITVHIPYPEGTSGKTHDFVIAHMITVPVNGFAPGDVEMPMPVEHEDYLEVQFKGLSPVLVQYKKTEIPHNLPKTGDGSTPIASLFALAGVTGAAGFVLYKKRRKK